MLRLIILPLQRNKIKEMDDYPADGNQRVKP